MGTRAEDVIVTFGGDDHVSALHDEDRVCAGDGDDVITDFDHWQVRIDLGAGNDRMTDTGTMGEVLAGAGDDRLALDADAIDVSLGSGDDMLRVRRNRRRNPDNTPCVGYEDVERPLTIDLRRGVARGQGHDRLLNVHCLRLGRFGDQVVGSNGRDAIDTGGGADVVRALAGNDGVFNYNDGADLYYLGPGNDEGVPAGGPDQVYGGPGRDSIQGLSGADRLYGGPGNDQVNATFYCDTASSAGTGMGDPSPNQVYGGSGNDEVTGDRGNDVIDGGPGVDHGYPGPTSNSGFDVVRSLERLGHCP